MSEQRRRVVMGLLLLVSALTEHRAESAPSPATTKTTGGDAQRNMRRVVEIVRHVEGSRGRQGTGRTESPVTSRTGSPSWDRDLSSRADRRNQAIVFTDLKMKEKIIKHFTGPLVFSSKCRKTAYKVYHQTRDCTIPAYFKRCARLLTRLAGSPLCTEG